MHHAAVHHLAGFRLHHLLDESFIHSLVGVLRSATLHHLASFRLHHFLDEGLVHSLVRVLGHAALSLLHRLLGLLDLAIVVAVARLLHLAALDVLHGHRGVLAIVDIFDAALGLLALASLAEGDGDGLLGVLDHRAFLRARMEFALPKLAHDLAHFLVGLGHAALGVATLHALELLGVIQIRSLDVARSLLLLRSRHRLLLAIGAALDRRLLLKLAHVIVLIDVRALGLLHRRLLRHTNADDDHHALTLGRVFFDLAALGVHLTSHLRGALGVTRGRRELEVFHVANSHFISPCGCKGWLR